MAPRVGMVKTILSSSQNPIAPQENLGNTHEAVSDSLLRISSTNSYTSARQKNLSCAWPKPLLTRRVIGGLLLVSHILFGAACEIALAQEVKVIGVEVTQGIQAFTTTNPGILALNRKVTLIKDKVTLVRVYLDTSSSWGYFTGSLWISQRNGPGMIVQALQPSVRIVPNHIERESLQSRLDFLVPSQLTGADGLVISTLHLTGVSQTITTPMHPNMSAPSCVGCDFQVTVSLLDSAPLRIRLVTIDYQKNSHSYGTAPSVADAATRNAQIASWLRRAYPVRPNQLEVTTAYMILDLNTYPDPTGKRNLDYRSQNDICELTNGFLSEIVRPGDVRDGKPDALPTTDPLRNTHYVGLVYDGTDLGVNPEKRAPLFRRGCADQADSQAPSDREDYFKKMASAPTGPTGPDTLDTSNGSTVPDPWYHKPPWFGELGDGTSGYWDTDGEYGDWYVGHELGHLLGLTHIPEQDPGENVCSPYNTLSTAGYPFPNGQLSDTDGIYAGLDTRGTIVWDFLTGAPSGTGMMSLPGQWWHDMMTYCVRQWISSVSYEHIYCRLFAENGLIGPKSCYGFFPVGSLFLNLFNTEEDVPYDVRLTPVPPVPPLPHHETLPADVAKPMLAPSHAPLESEPPLSEGKPAKSVPHLSVQASVNLKTRTGDFQLVTVLNDHALSAPKADDRVQLQLTYEDGQTKNYTFDVPSMTGKLVADGTTQWLKVRVPFAPQPVKIELVVLGKVVDEMPVTNLPARLRNFKFRISAKTMEHRAGFKQKRAVFSWDFELSKSLAAGQHVYFVVKWSFDGGATWDTVALVGDSKFEVPLERLENVHDVRLRVTASNGFDSITETSESLDLFPK